MLIRIYSARHHLSSKKRRDLQLDKITVRFSEKLKSKVTEREPHNYIRSHIETWEGNQETTLNMILTNRYINRSINILLLSFIFPKCNLNNHCIFERILNTDFSDRVSTSGKTLSVYFVVSDQEPQRKIQSELKIYWKLKIKINRLGAGKSKLKHMI